MCICDMLYSVMWAYAACMCCMHMCVIYMCVCMLYYMSCLHVLHCMCIYYVHLCICVYVHYAYAFMWVHILCAYVTPTRTNPSAFPQPPHDLSFQAGDLSGLWENRRDPFSRPSPLPPTSFKHRDRELAAALNPLF